MTTWWRGAEPVARRALVAATAGWMLDAMDVMLYAFALGAIREEFALTAGQAGALASVTLLASSVGGTGAGALAERYGRARVLRYAVLTYSVFTALTATAASVWQLVLWRTLLGLGMGGEWSAGSVLVAETWRAEDRGKAVGVMQSGWAVGYILPAGFRPSFSAVRLAAPLPGRPPLPPRSRSGSAGTCRSRPGGHPRLRDPGPRTPRGVRRGTSGVPSPPRSSPRCCSLPTEDSSPGCRRSSRRHRSGGAGMGVVKSTGWIVPMQLGAPGGIPLLRLLADRFGRRPVFLAFVLSSAVIVPLYGAPPGRDPPHVARTAGRVLRARTSRVRRDARGAYPTRLGPPRGVLLQRRPRRVGARPAAIGAIADSRGLGGALGFTAMFYVAAGLPIFRLPEAAGWAPVSHFFALGGNCANNLVTASVTIFSRLAALSFGRNTSRPIPARSARGHAIHRQYQAARFELGLEPVGMSDSHPETSGPGTSAVVVDRRDLRGRRAPRCQPTGIQGWYRTSGTPWPRAAFPRPARPRPGPGIRPRGGSSWCPGSSGVVGRHRGSPVGRNRCGR